MLRLDMNLVWNIVNLIVLYLLLKHFLVKPVMDIIGKRQAMIEQSISNARNSETQAQQLKGQYEEKIKASQEEGARLVEEAKQNARLQYDQIVKEAEAQADRIIENAHKTASADQEKAMRQAQAQIAGLVVAAAAKVVGSETGDLKNQALYDKFIAEAGDFHDAGSK
ncbi:MAG TPA: F0F1 ATP synthase subunit B [Candidatus Hungatella pullicola]|nr:F0F1 ATP synthase subunit B [Candidatus Hungatella pullicola]